MGKEEKRADVGRWKEEKRKEEKRKGGGGTERDLMTEGGRSEEEGGRRKVRALTEVPDCGRQVVRQLGIVRVECKHVAHPSEMKRVIQVQVIRLAVVNHVAV